MTESGSGVMLTNYFTLRALAAELQEILPGYRVAEIFSQKKNELILTLSHTEREELAVLISIDPAFHYLYATPRHVRGRKNSVDLFTQVIDQGIEKIEISPHDRIINIALSNSTHLSLYLYGTAASNIYLVDDERMILEAFKRNAELRGTPRKEIPGRRSYRRHIP